MSGYTKKLVFAATLSLLGSLASWGWYTMTAERHSSTQAKEIAHLDFQRNEVQRRPAKHVIWERIDEGEVLHTGEAVRTAPDSEAKIVFNSGAEVDLDPESVVILEENGDKMSLDFVKGNLLVKGGASRDFALKSGNTSITVADADVSLGKGAGKGVDVQVLRGSAQVNSGDKKLTLDQNNGGVINDEGVDVNNRFFKNVTPDLNEKVFIKNGEAANFKWAPLANDYVVRLEAGPRRDSLKQIGETSGDKGELKVQLKPGVQFWRLVAVSKKDAKEVHQSVANKVTVVAIVPPKILNPAIDQIVALTNPSQKVELHWTNPSHLTTIQVDIARDPQLKSVVDKPLVLGDATAASVSLVEDGTYYWRVTGWRPGNKDAYSSAIVKFNLKTKFELSPPELKVPLADAHVPFEAVVSGAGLFAWTPVDGVSQYHLYVEDLKGAKDQKSPGTIVLDKQIAEISQLKMTGLKPGHYRWTVTSVDDDAKESKKAPARNFTIEELPTLPWADNLQQENYQYVTEKPSVRPLWKASAKTNYKNFKITVKSDDGTPDLVSKTDGKETTVGVPHDGLYHVTVEAVDDAGITLARSSPRDFFVEPKPLLPAPAFAERTPASIQAQNNGSAQITWKPVIGARGYNVEVKDGAGKVVKKEKYSSAAGVVKNLLPGNYKVSLSTVDEFGRVGPKGEEKALVVPDTSDAKPPSFKKLQIH